MKSLLHWIVVGSFFLSNGLNAAEVIYIVKRGDTLSKISAKKLGYPVYGVKGSLHALLGANPQIKNPNLIFPNQKIKLGGIDMPKLASKPIEAAKGAPGRNIASVEEEKKFQQKSTLAAHLGFQYSRLDAGASIFLSDLSPKLDLIWNLVWSSRWATEVHLGVVSEKIQGDVSATPRSIVGGNNARKDFDFTLYRTWSEKAKTGIAIGAKDKVFSRTPGTTSVTLDRQSIAFAQLKHEQALYVLDKSIFGAKLAGEYLLKRSGLGYDVNGGFGGSGGLFIRHELEKVSIEANATYGYEKQNTSLMSHKETTLGGSLGLVWTFN